MKSWPNYAAGMLDDPASDGAAISNLLAKSNRKFPQRAARIRMFHLPTPDKRTELMIIYGEALPENSPVPLEKTVLTLWKSSSFCPETTSRSESPANDPTEVVVWLGRAAHASRH